MTGLVQGGDTSAHGAVTIHGRTVALDDIDATLGPVAIVSATTLTGHVLTSGGSASLTAGGDIDWGTLTVGTQLSATSTGGAIALGTATSGGTQTLTAEGDLTFTRLTTAGIPGDAGDVDLTSVTGLVQGGDTSAHGAVTIHGRTVALDDIDATLGPVAIVSATTLTGHVLTSGGSASLTAGGDIDWGTLTVGTQLSATSTGGAIALGTATSGGTQTLTAEGDLTFTRLTTAGIPGDAGDVDLTSVTGLVQGGDTSAHGAVTIHGRTVALDDIDATLGPVAIVSATTLTGHVLTSGGSASLTAGGDIDWGTLTVGTQLSATSTGGAIALGTATSGGTQTLTAEGDLTFTRLTTTGIPADAGDVDLRSFEGSIIGATVSAHGGFEADAARKLSIQTLTALGAVQVSAGTELSLNAVTAGSGSNFFSPVVQINELRPAPGVTPPFVFGLAGYSGGIGTFASVAIDAPMSAVILSELREDDAILLTNATSIGVANGYIVDTLRLTTPFQTVYMNNQTPHPVNGVGVQLYDPSYAFVLEQNGLTTMTDTFVVQYNQPADVFDVLSEGVVLGASFLHDFERVAFDGDLDPAPSFDDFGMPLTLQHRRAALPSGSALLRLQVVPSVNLPVRGEIWKLVSSPDGLRIDVTRQAAR